jgi:uncharacterized protein
MLTAEKIRELLKMQRLPTEGGYFAETYRSELILSGDALRGRYSGERSIATAIYYMLTPDTFSAMHKLTGDEVYHFYLGDPIEMLLLKPDRSGAAILLGSDISAGMHLQHVVPGGTWQGSRLAPGGHFALLGTTMAPGFAREDYEHGSREMLSAKYPPYAPLITLLTR